MKSEDVTFTLDCTNRTTTPITFKSYDGTKRTLPVNTLPDNE